MKRWRKNLIGAFILATIMSTSGVVMAAETNSTENEIISTRVDINMPENIEFVNRAGTTFDHDAGTQADASYKRVWGRTQAWQGSNKISSYTRARYEKVLLGTILGDSRRQYSPTFGAKSYAISGKCDNSLLSTYVGHTYYGV